MTETTIESLETVARKAVAAYALERPTVELVGQFTNTLYAVTDATGARYALRIGRPGWRTVDDLKAEITWLKALDADTDIGAPVPIDARDGAPFVVVDEPGGPTYYCMLTTWVEGRLLAEDLSGTHVQAMGELFARLHAHAAAFKPPQDFSMRKMSGVFSRGETVVLFSPVHRAAFSDAAYTVYQQVAARVDAAFAALYRDPGGLHLIHNDLHHENIKIDGERLRPFDFEDTLWGYAVQDIAMALQDLMMDTQPALFLELRAAFRAGYESLRPWPETAPGQIDTFRIGRMLWVTNYVALNETAYLEQHIAWTLKPFQRFLDTGELSLIDVV